MALDFLKAVDKALEAVGQSTIKTMAKRGAKGLGVGAVAEGITEAGQDMLNAIGTDVALGREPRSLSQLKEHLLSAGVAGMVAGGFFGAGAGTVGGYLDSSAEKKKRLAKDEADKKNAIIEIRARTCGLEASLFASDLFKMYEKVSHKKKWSLEIISISKSDAGGLKEVIASRKGKNIWTNWSKWFRKNNFI